MSGSMYRRRQHHRKKDTGRSEDLYSQTSLPQVNLNTRVRLPPINADIHGIYAYSSRSTRGDWSAENVTEKINVRLPRVSMDSSNAGTRPARVVRPPQSNGAPSFPKPPEFYFPRAYSVLPPIGKSGNLVSSLPTPGEVGEKESPVHRIDKQHGNQRKSSITRTKGKGSPSRHQAKTSAAASSTDSQPPSFRTRLNRSQAISDKAKNQALTNSTQLTSISLIETGEKEPTSSQAQIQAKITPPAKVRHLEDLERLELCKEAKEFFSTPYARRRRLATCTGLDPSLMTAVDIIRDMLLRQAMEELCMMW